MKGLTIEQMEFLADKGLDAADMIAFAKMSAKRNSNAERQARWRARKRGEGVTNNVTDNALSPPIDNHTPPVSSDEETTAPPRKRKTKVVIAKPEGVSDQTWTDWCAMRDRQKAPISETVIAGYRREATKAGWTLEAALAESVLRNWRGFNAEWVKPAGKPANDGGSLVDSILARRAQSP